MSDLVLEEVGKRVHVGSLSNAVESKEVSIDSHASHGLHLMPTL